MNIKILGGVSFTLYDFLNMIQLLMKVTPRQPNSTIQCLIKTFSVATLNQFLTIRL